MVLKDKQADIPFEVQNEHYNPRGEAEKEFCCPAQSIANIFLRTEKDALLSFQQIEWSNNGRKRTSHRITEVCLLCLQLHGLVGLGCVNVPGHVWNLPLPPAQRSIPASIAPGPPLPKEEAWGPSV